MSITWIGLLYQNIIYTEAYETDINSLTIPEVEGQDQAVFRAGFPGGRLCEESFPLAPYTVTPIYAYTFMNLLFLLRKSLKLY